MMIAVRLSVVLVLGAVTLGECDAADQPLTRAEITKIGNAATAYVKKQHGAITGSAFCIHASGIFLTTDNVIHPFSQIPGLQEQTVSEVTLVLNPGLPTETTHSAQVVRHDKDLNLAVLRIEGLKDLPVLEFASDEKLSERMEVVSFGYVFDPGAARNLKQHPPVKVGDGKITGLRRKGGRLHRLQLDEALHSRNSGGPVLDKSGKVVGVILAGIPGGERNTAIPVGTVARFVTKPELHFEPPKLTAANIHQPVVFEAKVSSIVPSAIPITVELILQSPGGRERSLPMQAEKDAYRVSAVPLPPAQGALMLRVSAQFDNGLLDATVEERAIKIGPRVLKLSEVRSVEFRPSPRLVLQDGKTVEGTVSGLEAVPIRLGDQSIPLNLSKATQLKLAPSVVADQLACTVLVRQGGQETLRQTENLMIEGLLPAFPQAGDQRPGGIAPPSLEGDRVVRKLAAPVADVVVGGNGRYLILHLPTVRKLAVFDVSVADVVGHIPLTEDAIKFAAGLEHLVVIHPGAGTIECWQLTGLKRELVASIPVEELIKSIALGSGSKGPLLLHLYRSSEISNLVGSTSIALIDLDSLKLQQRDIKVAGMVEGAVSSDVLHIRAAANGQVFGMWSADKPIGIGSMVVSAGGVKTYYDVLNGGPVLPGPDGKLIFTRSGQRPPEFAPPMRNPMRLEMFRPDDPMLPACHGSHYLSLAPGGKPRVADIRIPGQPKPIATLTELEVAIPAPPPLAMPRRMPDAKPASDFTFDKRVHLIPDARLVIVIPESNDQLVLRRFDQR